MIEIVAAEIIDHRSGRTRSEIAEPLRRDFARSAEASQAKQQPARRFADWLASPKGKPRSAPIKSMASSFPPLGSGAEIGLSAAGFDRSQSRLCPAV